MKPLAAAPIAGTTDPKFVRVREAFAANFASGLEHGGGVAVMLDNQPVVELWGGHADAAKTRPWRQDTLINVWSCTKGVMATAMAMLVERGKLDYAAPVARWWPEFATGGKEKITLDLVLSHQAGLNGITVPMDEAGLLAWDPYVAALAAMAPLWEPGSRAIYHALSYGHLAGEILRRVDGRSPGRFVAEEIAGPLGADFFIGLPEREEHRVAEMIEGPKASDWVPYVLASPFPHSCMNPSLSATSPNHRAWRAAEVPGGNGQATAPGLAKIYAALASGGGGLIRQETIAEAARPRVRGIDESFGSPTAFAAGFQIDNPLTGKDSFGHSGWGGSYGFADPEAKLGFAYVTNRMLGFDDGIDLRRKSLIDAVYASLRD
jgi:CubicO group peptidase (beta-lactamase class C family)